MSLCLINLYSLILHHISEIHESFFLLVSAGICIAMQENQLKIMV